jgi:hypothetical protein
MELSKTWIELQNSVDDFSVTNGNHTRWHCTLLPKSSTTISKRYISKKGMAWW